MNKKGNPEFDALLNAWNNKEDNPKLLCLLINDNSDKLIESVSDYVNADLKSWGDENCISETPSPSPPGVPPIIPPPNIYCKYCKIAGQHTTSSCSFKKIAKRIEQRKYKPSLKYLTKKIRSRKTSPAEKQFWKATRKSRKAELQAQEIKRLKAIKEKFRYQSRRIKPTTIETDPKTGKTVLKREFIRVKRDKVPYKPRKIGGRKGAYKKKGWEIKHLKREVKALAKYFVSKGYEYKGQIYSFASKKDAWKLAQKIIKSVKIIDKSIKKK